MGQASLGRSGTIAFRGRVNKACAIAGLEGSVTVRQHNIMEAIGYRNLDRPNFFNM